MKDKIIDGIPFMASSEDIEISTLTFTYDEPEKDSGITSITPKFNIYKISELPKTTSDEFFDMCIEESKNVKLNDIYLKDMPQSILDISELLSAVIAVNDKVEQSGEHPLPISSDEIKYMITNKILSRIAFCGHVIANGGRKGFATHVFIPEIYYELLYYKIKERFGDSLNILKWTNDFVFVMRICDDKENNMSVCNNPVLLKYNEQLHYLPSKNPWCASFTIKETSGTVTIQKINSYDIPQNSNAIVYTGTTLD